MLRRSTLACLIGLLLVPGSVWPQRQPLFGSARQSADGTNLFQAAPRALRQHLARARTALDEHRYADAVDELGSLLTNPDLSGSVDGIDQQDYFLADTEGAETQVSIKAEAQRLLGSMPAKGREWYELKFGPEARRLMEEALSSGDLHQLSEVTRKYFHTRAGYEATMLIGRHHLDHGRPLAAALCFKRVADTGTARAEYEPELSILLATCWLHSDMADKATETLVDLRRRLPRSEVTVAGRIQPLFSSEPQALQWLTEQVGQMPLSVARAASEWVIFRGSPTRNVQSRGGLPILNYRWRLPTANDPADEELIAQSRKEYLSKKIPALPGMHPLVVLDTVLMRTPDRLVAVDLASGKRIWEFPWFESPDERLVRESRGRMQGRSATTRGSELDQRLYDDAAHGQMSSDGKHVYVLTDLDYATMNGLPSAVMIRGRGEPLTTAKTPKLVALSIEEQGKLRWIVGGDSGEDEPRMSGMFILGAPLPMMDSLYVMAERNGEIRLVVLDTLTGRLQWSQQLAHVESDVIQVDPQRRLSGATPSFADGVLVCPTSAGAVVAVDLANRSLLWGYQYPDSRPHAAGMPFRAPRPQKPAGERWDDATVTLAEGSVILTPTESNHLHCLDLLTGEKRWDPIRRSEWLYVACIHDGKIILVGRDSIDAIRVADGKPAWTNPVSLGGAMPSGRGFYESPHYYLPTTDHRLLKVDLRGGNVAREMATRRVLGNLVAYKDQVISHGVDELAAYYQIEPLRLLVERRIAENPADQWALARHGELLLQDGKRQEAVSVLRRAFQLDPDDDTTRSLLVTTLLSVLDADFAANRDVATELESLVDEPSQRAEFLRLVAAGLQAEGDTLGAFEYYLKLAMLDGSQLSPAEDRTSQVTPEPALAVRRDRWVQARLSELLAGSSDDLRRVMNELLRAELSGIANDSSIRSLRRFMNHFGNYPLTDEERLAVATRLVEKNHHLEAHLMLAGIENSKDPAIAGAAVARLARLLDGAGWKSAAAVHYARLAERFGDVVCLDGQSGAEIARAAFSDASRPPAGPTPWPYGRHLVSRDGYRSNPFGGYQHTYPLAIERVVGPFPEHITIGFNHNENKLVIRTDSGAVQQQVFLGDSNKFWAANFATSRVQTLGHLLIVSLGFEVLAIDTLALEAGEDDAVLWRRDVSSQYAVTPRSTRRLRDSTLPRAWTTPLAIPAELNGTPIGQAVVLGRSGVCLQKAGELHCLDPLTGETLWTRGEVPPGADLFGDEEYLFVVAPNDDTAMVLRVADGGIVGRRPVVDRIERWSTSGRHVLACRIVDDGIELWQFDAFTGREDWRRQFAVGSRGQLAGNDRVAFLEPDGHFVMLARADGTAQIDIKLHPEPFLSDLFVIEDHERYLVATTRPQPASTSDTNVRAVINEFQCPMITGRLYSIDRQSGRHLWPAAAVISQYCLPLDQPADSPLLVFLRHVSDEQSRNEPRNTLQGSVLIVDKRDGRQVYATDDLGIQIHSYEIEALPDRNRVRVTLPMQTLTISLTEEPQPPSPPVQTLDITRSNKGALDSLGRVTDSIIDVLTGRRNFNQDPPQKAAIDDTDRE